MRSPKSPERLNISNVLICEWCGRRAGLNLLTEYHGRIGMKKATHAWWAYVFLSCEQQDPERRLIILAGSQKSQSGLIIERISV
jgi:hypothetical protein